MSSEPGSGSVPVLSQVTATERVIPFPLYSRGHQSKAKGTAKALPVSPAPSTPEHPLISRHLVLSAPEWFDPAQLLLQNASMPAGVGNFSAELWRCEARRGKGKGKRGVSCHLAGKQMSVQRAARAQGSAGQRSPAWRREAISALSLILHFVYVHYF